MLILRWLFVGMYLWVTSVPLIAQQPDHPGEIKLIPPGLPFPGVEEQRKRIQDLEHKFSNKPLKSAPSEPSITDEMKTVGHINGLGWNSLSWGERKQYIYGAIDVAYGRSDLKMESTKSLPAAELAHAVSVIYQNPKYLIVPVRNVFTLVLLDSLKVSMPSPIEDQLSGLSLFFEQNPNGAP